MGNLFSSLPDSTSEPEEEIPENITNSNRNNDNNTNTNSNNTNSNNDNNGSDKGKKVIVDKLKAAAKFRQAVVIEENIQKRAVE